MQPPSHNLIIYSISGGGISIADIFAAGIVLVLSMAEVSAKIIAAGHLYPVPRPLAAIPVSSREKWLKHSFKNSRSSFWSHRDVMTFFKT